MCPAVHEFRPLSLMPGDLPAGCPPRNMFGATPHQRRLSYSQPECRSVLDPCTFRQGPSAMLWLAGGEHVGE